MSANVKVIKGETLYRPINKVTVKEIQTSYLRIIKQDYREMNKKEINIHLAESLKALEENEEYLRSKYFKYTSTIDEIIEKSFREKLVEMIKDIYKDIKYIRKIKEYNK